MSLLKFLRTEFYVRRIDDQIREKIILVKKKQSTLKYFILDCRLACMVDQELISIPFALIMSFILYESINSYSN